MGGALKLTGQWPAPGMTFPNIACCDCLHLRAVFRGFKAPAVAFLLLTMSTSTSCPIPGSRDQLPDGYSTTPGGTLYATTPGGTRIIYDRKFLLECKNSPIAQTPPCCLPQIPGVTIPPTVPPFKLELLKEQKQTEEEITDDEQFEMDM